MTDIKFPTISVDYSKFPIQYTKTRFYEINLHTGEIFGYTPSKHICFFLNTKFIFTHRPPQCIYNLWKL